MLVVYVREVLWDSSFVLPSPEQRRLYDVWQLLAAASASSKMAEHLELLAVRSPNDPRLEVVGSEAAAAILGRVCPEVEWVAATVEHRRLIRVGSLLGRIHTDTLALTLYEGCVSESRDVVDGLSSRVSEARTELASLLGFSSRQVDWLVSLTSDGWYPEDLAATRRFCDLVDVVLGSD